MRTMHVITTHGQATVSIHEHAADIRQLKTPECQCTWIKSLCLNTWLQSKWPLDLYMYSLHWT